MSTSGSDPGDFDRGPAVKTRPFDETTLEAANVYAEALLNAAAKEGNVEEALRELAEIRRDIIERYPEFAALLMSTSMSVEDKDRILASALEGRALPVVTNFMRVLNRNGRTELLGLVLDRAYELWDQRQNRVHVNVRSAVPLDEPQLQAVKARLAKLLGNAQPVLHTTVDPSLIGGLVIQVGDQLHDLSVRRRLQLLRGQLVDVKGAEIRAATASFLQN
jgi:F-type H+-transporting ATPase subunit delta